MPTTNANASSTTAGSSTSSSNGRVLIVCDVQPDVIRKISPPERNRRVDLIKIAVQAARTTRTTSTCTTIIHTLMQFDEPGYRQIDPRHPRLGVLRRLADAGNTSVNWFTSDELPLGPIVVTPENKTGEQEEIVVKRSTFLPHASDGELMEVLSRHCCIPSGADGATTSPSTGSTYSVTLVGYQPTAQALCHILGDVLAAPSIQILKECILWEDERDSGQQQQQLMQQQQQPRTQVWLDHGLLFNEQVVSLVDFLAETDTLHEQIDCLWEDGAKYVCDTGRGGHLCLFLPYLIRDYGYVEWMTQPWYEENSLTGSNKQYRCPLGRRIVDLCDEPKFSRSLRFFLAGRQYLDEKDLLYELVPEFMPPTFGSIGSAKAYAEAIMTGDDEGEPSQRDEPSNKFLWFVKAVNQNGGRAVRVTTSLPTSLASDEQLQLHVPRPLLYDGRFKCHVKTYQHIFRSASDSNWHVHMHDLFYLSTASRPWSADDLSDEAQITTMRTHRLYPDSAFRKRWNLTELFHAKMRILMERAVLWRKLHDALQVDLLPASDGDGKAPATSTAAVPQFEVNSADWMLDQDGRVYLIECNGIPVLYDPTSPKKQALVTKGLRLYDRLYHQDPAAAVVNDSDLIREALALALTGKVPSTSLWKHVATIPALVTTAAPS